MSQFSNKYPDFKTEEKINEFLYIYNNADSLTQTIMQDKLVAAFIYSSNKINFKPN